VVVFPPPAHGCLAAYPAGQPVRIADQEVLVVWDGATKTEHFVRRADFQAAGPAASFGFLVPTPTVPQLAETDGAVFDRLGQLTAPEHVRDYDVRLSLIQSLLPRPKSRGIGAAALSTREARVVGRAHVAGYDATVLEADDPKALTDWLDQHGFDARPEITDWAKPYVDAGWKVTAFEFNPSKDDIAAATVATPAVRMTFGTDRPVFPYRVPKDNRGGGQLLRLFYVGDERAMARVDGVTWHATVKYARELGERLSGALIGVASASPSRARWLTVFEDSRWPGGEHDLYFEPASVQAPLLPPPIEHRSVVWLPLDVLLPAGILVGWFLRRRRGSSATATATR
jgi:hypothetical protein